MKILHYKNNIILATKTMIKIKIFGPIKILYNKALKLINKTTIKH
jgi:hypothetical protein